MVHPRRLIFAIQSNYKIIQDINRGISHVSYWNIPGEDGVIMAKNRNPFFITDFYKMKKVDSENAKKY